MLRILTSERQITEWGVHCLKGQSEMMRFHTMVLISKDYSFPEMIELIIYKYYR